MCRKRALSFAACAWLAMTTLVFADGVMLDGVSPRALSRGGTNMGFADNGGIIYDNPAAMVNIDGCGLLDVGVDMLIVSGRYSDPQNQLGTSTTFTPCPQIALIRKSEDGDWAYGFGVFTPAGFSERFHLIGPEGAPHVYESFGALVKFLPAVAYRVTDDLSIGATLGVGVSYAELEGPYFLQGPSLPGPYTLLHTHGMGAALVWSVGMQYQWTCDTTIGATYQSSSPIKVRGNTTVDVLAPPLGSSNYESSADVTWPQTVDVGIRHQLCAHRVVAADVIWYGWEGAFDQIPLSLHNPSNSGFPPQINDHLPLNWHDSVALHLGYEQELNNRTVLRLGYMYTPNPIPNNTLTPYIQGIMQHAVTVGLGRTQCFGWDIDLGYVHEFSLAERVGTSSLIGGDFNNSDQSASVDAILLDLIKRY